MRDLIQEEFGRLIHGEMDGTSCRRAMELLTGRFPEMERQTVGKSVLGQPIELLTFGESRGKICLYVGTHHGMESITASVLLAFAWELAGSGICGRERYAILPMLNPDGADLRIHGIGAPILAGREARIAALLDMQPDGDFGRWQANIRGVDLNHNYDAGFAAYQTIQQEQSIGPGATKYAGDCPESEPESRALAEWIRRNRERIAGVFTLHSQGREIYYSSGGKVLPGCREIAEKLGELTGYSPSIPTGTAAYGGLTDWLIAGMGLPSFTLECGWGRNPLPMADLDGILAELLEALIDVPEILEEAR